MATQMKIINFSQVFCFVGLLCFPALAQVHPDKVWKVLNVDRFELIYDAENQPLAELYAERLKVMASPLQDYWQVFPQKTVFVLNDRTDLTNGYATYLPYPLIMIFPVVPGPTDTIGEYNDWAWEIGIHEYTHILEFSQRRGVVWGLSYIFGSIMTPNALLPRWWLEGAAVEAETRFSKAGRLRSKMQAGVLRSLAESGRLDSLRLAEINEFTIPTWPYGSRPYLFGSLLWSDWVNSEGPKAVKDTHYFTGGRLPYFLDGALEPVFGGKGQVELFDLTKQKMITNAKAEIQQLSQVPLTRGQIIDPEMIESLSPAVSPDGLKLAYISKDETLRRRVQILVRPNSSVPFDPSHRIQWFGKEFDQNLPSGSPLPQVYDFAKSGHSDDDSPPGGNITRISWHPDSKSFVFDQVLKKNRFREMSDLWSFDLVKGKATRLTTAARAREASYSPDGFRIAYVQIQAGRAHLAVFDTRSQQSARVFESSAQGRVSFPCWLDNDTLAFSARDQGREKILRLNLKTRAVDQVLDGWKDPQFLSVEKNQILFTSTQNGVRNLYSSRLDFTNARPITHSTSHIMASSYDEAVKRYYYTEIDDQGLQLKALYETEVQNLPRALPVVGDAWGDSYPDYEMPVFASTPVAVATAEGPSPKPAVPTLKVEAASPAVLEKALVSETTSTTQIPLVLTTEARDYSALGYLWPRYWLPFVSWDDRGTLLSISTSGTDPLQKHAYTVQGVYDSAIKRGSYIFSYANQSFWPLLNLTSYDYSLQLATPGTYARALATQVMASWEVESVSPDWFVGLGLGSGSREKFGSISRRILPFLSTTYRSAFQSGNQISPESGWLGSLMLSAPRDLDLERNFAVTEASGTLYWSRWLPKRHVVMMKAQMRMSDELIDQVENMEQSVSLQSNNDTPFAEYLNRGYPSGAFLARNILGTSIEYRLPLSRLEKGSDGVPLYVHRWHGAVVADGTYFDGYAFDFKSSAGNYHRIEGGRVFWSAGIEARFDVNIGYHIPLTFGIGMYAPLDSRFTEEGARFGTFLML